MRSRRIRQIGHAGLPLLALAALLLLSAGCDDTSTDLTGISNDTNATDVSVDAVRNRVQMTDEQAAKLDDAMAQWRRDRDARRNARQNGNTDADAVDDVRPGLEFLARAAAILDRDQMLALVGALQEQREARIGERRAGLRERMQGRHHRQGPGQGPSGEARLGGHRGRRGVGPHDGAGPLGLLRQLDLDQTQRASVREAMQTLQATVRQLHTSHRDGQLSDEAFRDALQAAHEQFETTLAGVLTADQATKLQELRREGAVKALTRMIERLEANQDKHLDLLTRILGLDETQRAGFASIGADMVTNLQALLQQLRDGSIDPKALHQEQARLHDASRTAMRALLNDEQAALFDSLATMLHRRGPRP